MEVNPEGGRLRRPGFRHLRPGRGLRGLGERPKAIRAVDPAMRSSCATSPSRFILRPRPGREVLRRASWQPRAGGQSTGLLRHGGAGRCAPCAQPRNPLAPHPHPPTTTTVYPHAGIIPVQLYYQKLGREGDARAGLLRVVVLKCIISWSGSSRRLGGARCLLVRALGSTDTSGCPSPNGLLRMALSFQSEVSVLTGNRMCGWVMISDARRVVDGSGRRRSAVGSSLSRISNWQPVETSRVLAWVRGEDGKRAPVRRDL